MLYKQFLPEGKRLNFDTGAGKFIEACFEREATISRVGEGT